MRVPLRRDTIHAPLHHSRKTQTDSLLQGLAALQLKMQAWLGRLGSWADALALGSGCADLHGKAISKRWDVKDMIGLKVSFPGMQRADPVLWLDNLLPMVGLCYASAIVV